MTRTALAILGVVLSTLACRPRGDTPSGALRTHMPDYEDLKSGRRLAPPPIGGASAAARRARAANALR